MKIKRILSLWTAAAAIALISTGCTAPTDYKDGTYEGKSELYQTEDSEEDAASGYGVVQITLQDNAIIRCTFKTYELDGTQKDEDYGKQRGEIANPDFYNKAQKAVQACPIYAEKLVETNDIEAVDVISGATVNHNEFKEAVYDALNKAAK